MQHKSWYLRSESDVLNDLKTSLVLGLSEDEVANRIIRYGPNRIPDIKRKSAVRILASQFTDLFVIVLILAAVLAAIIGEPQDSLVILAIVILNAVLGFYQEFRAEKAMESLKALAAPTAKVRRTGKPVTILGHELVPGDIVFLESGNIVPADLRLLECFQLSMDESLLTGESHAVEKETSRLFEGDASISDQKNMAFKGTTVVVGRGLGVVVETGPTTQIGRLANLLKDQMDARTPLQNKTAEFARKISVVVLVVCIVIYLIGLLQGIDPLLMFMTSLSLAVAAIPEALPAVVAVSLSLGAKIMARKKALVRKLPAVEALGAVTYICTDKTGTLTENRMRAKSFYVNGRFWGAISSNEEPDSWSPLIRAIALNNDANVDEAGQLHGDPTETALVEAILPHIQSLRVLHSAYPRVNEIPFSSERKMMSTVNKGEKEIFLVSKGAPEKIIPLCKSLGGDIVDIYNAVEKMANQGFRVLAFAERRLKSVNESFDLGEVEKGLNFLGLVGLIDPPRKEVRSSINQCKASGIHVVMITGDHPSTAKYVANEIGIFSDSLHRTVTGKDLAEISDDDLKNDVKSIAVYARMAPEQKIRIVNALQSSGEIVAMTGDGVNDAPALRSADVGVSMGKLGTDVAREASHVILLDDNFATIVDAIREGRRIYDNIRKFIKFALSGNSGEIWTLFLAPFVGLPTPLLPIHILWVNLVTDGLPGLALAVEPEERNIMHRLPRDPRESIFGDSLWQHCVAAGIITAGATLGVLAWAYHTGHGHWQSMAFTVLTMTQMGHVMAIRSESQSLFKLGLRSNIYLLGAVGLTGVLQMSILYVPSMNSVFKTEPLSASELLICFVVSTSVFLFVEIEKLLRRRGIKIFK